MDFNLERFVFERVLNEGEPGPDRVTTAHVLEPCNRRPHHPRRRLARIPQAQ